MLEIENLCKSYGALRVTQAFGLRLAPGARHALIGPNGAGKTTLVNLLTGTVKADAGSIRLAGEELVGLASPVRAQRGLVRTYQVNSLFMELTPHEAVALAIARREGFHLRFFELPRRARETGRRTGEEAAALLASVGLGSHLHTPTQGLPYGLQRLLEVALALACKPKVLLLDEPAAGVSAAASARLFDLIDRLPRDLAILLIEHDMRLVFRFASRISVLVSGAVLTEGTPAEVAADARVRQVYLGQGRAA